MVRQVRQVLHHFMAIYLKNLETTVLLSGWATAIGITRLESSHEECCALYRPSLVYIQTVDTLLYSNILVQFEMKESFLHTSVSTVPTPLD